MRSVTSLFARFALVGLLLAAASAGSLAQPAQVKTFASPEEAVSALVDAAKAKDANAFAAIFGPALKEWIISGDQTEDRAAVEAFLKAYEEKHEIAKQGEDKAVLSIGNDGFPFPFPLVRSAGGWAFDPEQGKVELLNRRIGENELTTIEVLQAIVDAQREYANLAQIFLGSPQYAQRFLSTPGKKDGLYWPAKEGEVQSPLGPLVAEAQREGYRAHPGGEPTPYYGYYFRMLTAQGPDANDGAREYIVGGRMIGGFAVIARPARYDISGFKTFIVNQDGDVYESDLGPQTAERAAAIRAFNPDSNWKKVEKK